METIGRHNMSLGGLWYEATKFSHAVTWSDTWLHALLAYEALWLLVSLFLLSPRDWSRPAALMMCLLHVALAPALNSLAHQHHALFSSQDYFSEDGFFLTVVYAAPFLLIALVNLVRLLLDTARLAVSVKRLQLARKARDKKSD